MEKKPEDILKDARERKGYTQSDMADKLGIGLRMYQKIEAGSFPKYKREQIQEIDQILATQLYEMIYEIPVHNELNEDSETYLQRRRVSKNSDSGPYMVPFVPVKAQAGYKKSYLHIDFINSLEKYPILPGVDPRGSEWRYFEVEGDSMRVPDDNDKGLWEGDLILCSLVPQMDWDNARNYYVHVLVTQEEVLIKRIFKKGSSKWVLISDNEDHYPQRLINISDVKELWVFRSHIRKRIPPPKKFEIKV